VEVVKRLLAMLEDEEGEDEYYEDNTVQMLERFANEEEEDVDYYVSDGGNYSYMYRSPYDCRHDAEMIAQKLVNVVVFRSSFRRGSWRWCWGSCRGSRRRGCRSC
jgi:hypothetical protein